MNRKQTGFNLAFVLIAVMGVLVVQDFWARRQAVATIPYSEFQKLVREDKVASVVVGQDQLSGELKEPINGKKRFVAVRVDADMTKELDQHGVEYRGQFDSNFITMLLSWIVPTALFFGIWIFLGRRMAKQLGGPGGGLMAIGKSKARVYVETDTKVTFADVAGVDEAKAELQEVVSFLKDPKQHGRLGARMPKGVLLVGPPGTGKTLLAKAVAGEAGVPFFSISGSEFVEMFVGVGAARVRDLFEQARAKAPAIIFIDELDALGRARGTGALGGHDEREQTLNQLLVELDGFDPSTGLVLLAARRSAEAVSLADFTQAIERLIAGLEKKNRVLNPRERRVVAHHEMGHAIVAMALPGTDPVHKISIIPRGVGALGYTIQRPTEDRFLMTRAELENKMAVLLGGRASEEVIFGHLSTGAADDLAKVTDIARSMVMRYAMVQALGPVAYEEERPPFLGGT